MFLYVVELLIVVLVIAFWFTQVMGPMLAGEPIFPLFWSKEERLRVQKKRAQHKFVELRLGAEVNDLEEELHEAAEECKKSKKNDSEEENS